MKDSEITVITYCLIKTLLASSPLSLIPLKIASHPYLVYISVNQFTQSLTKSHVLAVKAGHYVNGCNYMSETFPFLKALDLLKGAGNVIGIEWTLDGSYF